MASSRRAARPRDDEASASFGEAGVTLEGEIRAAFALGDGREVEECLGRLRGRADQTTETAPGFGQVAHLVGELAQPQIRFTADGRIFAHALEFLARFVDAIEAHQGVDVGEAFGLRIECRRFLCNGDGRNGVAFGGEHARELRARRAGSRLVGEHAVGKLVRGSEIERLERQVDARGEQPFGDLGRIEPGPQGFQCDGRATGIADFTHELDERLVAAQGLRAQDCCRSFVGLIEPHGGERHRGGRTGAFGIEFLPAPRGLRARADLLAFGGDFAGALRNAARHWRRMPP